MTDAAHQRLIESVTARANRLSAEELREWDDHGADLERNGTFKRRAHFASRHLVARVSDFEHEAETVEVTP